MSSIYMRRLANGVSAWHVYQDMARLATHLKTHALMFEPRVVESYSPRTGLRLLAVFAFLEALVGPRRAPPAVMLAAALVLIRYAGGVPLSRIGLYGWRRWTTSEKSYIAQVLPLAIVIFVTISASRLRALAADSALWTPAAVTLSSYLVWGFYQEVMYRGVLQTELVRRFGPWTGILAANVAYTLGPLHFYYFSTYDAPTMSALFAAVFAIGLFFGALFHRSGNLFIVGTLHGVGDAFLTGLRQLTR
jgi:membrane protease YdiL (CAAX protease family)